MLYTHITSVLESCFHVFSVLYSFKHALFKPVQNIAIATMKPPWYMFLYIISLCFLCVGDQSASETTDQAKLDARIQQIIDMEDVNTVGDLRTLNTGAASRYDRFWEECDKY